MHCVGIRAELKSFVLTCSASPEPTTVGAGFRALYLGAATPPEGEVSSQARCERYPFVFDYRVRRTEDEFTRWSRLMEGEALLLSIGRACPDAVERVRSFLAPRPVPGRLSRIARDFYFRYPRTLRSVVIIHSPDEADSAARFADDLRAGIDLPNRPFRIELIQHDGPTPSGTTWLSCTVERTLVTQVREALQTDPRKREDLAWAVRAVVFPWEPGWRQRTGLGLLYRMLALPYHAYLGPLTEGGYLLRGAQRALDELAALEVRSQSRLDICRGIRDFTTEPPVQHPGWSKVSLAYAEDLTARRNLILGGIGIVISAIALWVSLRAGGP